MNIQPVSFGKTMYTDNGAKYEKTNAGGYTGLAVGAGLSGFMIHRGLKQLKTAGKQIVKENLLTAEETKQAGKIIGKAGKIGMTVMTVITLALGFGIGKFIDNMINGNRKEEAEQAKNKQQAEAAENPTAQSVAEAETAAPAEVPQAEEAKA